MTPRTVHPQSSRALAVAVLALSVCSGPAASQSACPSDVATLFESMAGRWQVVDANGRSLGTSSIARVGSCGLREDWTAGASRGITVMAWQAAAGEVSVLGHDSDGSTATYSGTVESGRLTVDGLRATADGQSQAARAEYRPAEDGWIDHRLLLGPSSGELRETFVGRYATVEQMTRATPSEAPAAATSRRAGTDSSVVAASPERSEAVAPAAPTRVEPVSSTAERRTQLIEMTSPMILRLPLGPVEKLPDGYAWSTRDTADYVVRGVTVDVLRVTRSVRRGKVRLEVALDMVGRTFSQQVDLGVRLLEGEEPLASGELRKQKLGRGLTEQAENGYVRKTIQLELSAEQFEALTSDDAERPDLELTVVTGG